MKTNVNMIRKFGEFSIQQRTADSYLCATDMLKIYRESTGNERRINDFLNNSGTKEFINALFDDISKSGNSHVLMSTDLYESKSGRYGESWMHPYLFMKFSLWLNPIWEVQVMKWIYDNLIVFRTQAGDYYKEMCNELSKAYKEEYGKSADPLTFIREADILNTLVFESTKGKQRNEATEQELDLMNRLQKLNINMLKQRIKNKDRVNRLRVFAENYKITQ